VYLLTVHHQRALAAPTGCSDDHDERKNVGRNLERLTAEAAFPPAIAQTHRTIMRTSNDTV